MSDKLTRRSFLGLVSGAAAGTLLAACQPQVVERTVEVEVTREVEVEKEVEVEVEREVVVTAPPEEIKGVELWTGFGQGRMADAMAGAIERFDADTGFITNHIVIPWGDIRTKVIAATAAGNPPDVYRGWAWIVGDDAPIGALTDLSPFVEARPDANLDDYFPAALEQMKFQGKFYAVSISTQVQMMFYNKDRMREGGFDPDDIPTDLEGWEEIGEALYDVSPNGSINKIGYIPLVPDIYIMAYGAMFGAEFWDGDSRQCIANDATNGPIMVDLFNWCKGYTDKYGAEEIQAFMSSYSGNSYGRNTPDGVYYTGLLAIWLNRTWLYNDMLEYGPDVDFGVAKPPSPRGVTGKPADLDANMYLVPAGAQNAAGGFEFAWFMGSSPWVAINKAVPDSVTPSRLSNAQLPEVEEGQPWVAMARDEILPYALPVPSMPSVGYYQTKLKEALNSVLWDGMDAQEALDYAVEDAQLEVDQKFEQG